MFTLFDSKPSLVSVEVRDLSFWSCDEKHHNQAYFFNENKIFTFCIILSYLFLESNRYLIYEISKMR